MGHNQHHTVHDDAWMMIKHCSHDNPAQHDSILTGLYPYILKAGFAGFQNPQKIWNSPQKDCLRTRKYQFCNMLDIKVKRHLRRAKCVEKSCITYSHNKHQGVTTRWSLGAGLRGNGERMRK